MRRAVGSMSRKSSTHLPAFRRELRHAGDVPTGAIEARDESGFDWITRYDDYGYLASCPLRRQPTRCVKRYDDIDLISDISVWR